MPSGQQVAVVGVTAPSLTKTGAMAGDGAGAGERAGDRANKWKNQKAIKTLHNRNVQKLFFANVSRNKKNTNGKSLLADY